MPTSNPTLCLELSQGSDLWPSDPRTDASHCTPCCLSTERVGQDDGCQILGFCPDHSTAPSPAGQPQGLSGEKMGDSGRRGEREEGGVPSHEQGPGYNVLLMSFLQGRHVLG